MNFSAVTRIIIAALFIFCLVGVASAVVTQYNLTDGIYTIHIFNGTGTTTRTAPTDVLTVEYLVIGAAGGGGSFRGAGGGSGGFICGTFALSGGTSYNITVGTGGLGGLASGYARGHNGQNSSFANTTAGDGFNALGGGGGGAAGGTQFSGSDGGSGGGASHTGTPGSGTINQGYSGGSAYSAGGNYGSGGGGGSNNTGVTGTISNGGNGGDGNLSSITGTTKRYASGGGGSLYGGGGVPGIGGLGGGGNASWTAVAGYPGQNETGSGGGGGFQSTGSVGYGGGMGGSGIVILRYKFASNADFIGNTTSGLFPFPVAFTDLTTGFTPTDWNWTFGDGNYSAEQNPIKTYNFAGTFTVTFESSNATINKTITKTGYITVSTPGVPIPNFNANITSGKKPLIVQFTDLSVNNSYNSMTWDYSFGDGAGNSTDKNPLRTFPNAGSYDVNLIATNDMGSGNTKKPVYINVAEFVGFTRQDLTLSRGYNLTLYIRDEETRNLILDGSVELSGTLTGLFNATGGTYTTTSDYGVLVVRASAPGYYGSVQTYVMDTDRSDTIYLAPVPESGTMNTWYTPHQVRFTVINQYGAPVQNATVSANAINATIPDVWLQTMYGINPAAANDMLNGTLIMQGITSTDGAIVFTMHGSIRYNINVIDPATGALFSTSVMPIGADYPIRTSAYAFPLVSNSTYSKIANTSLTFSEPNSSYVTLGLVYHDTSGSTTSLKFYVIAVHNRTVVYSTDLGNPGTAVRYANFTLRNERGYQYIWNYTAVRT